MSLARREFIRRAGVAGLAALLGQRVYAELEAETAGDPGPMPVRPLGKTGESLSVIGFGGIVAMGGTQKDADRRVNEAIGAGVTYFDVAPSYGAGEAEEKLGPALQPHRDKVFLACKTQRRDRQGAEEELGASLKRMRTDRFDLYQLHAITDVEKDVKAALGPGGAMETLVRAREQGLVRFLGFSAHSPAAALAAMESGLFDTILYPVNFVCHYSGSFDAEVLAEARRREMGILTLKAMARTRWDADGKPRQRGAYPKCWYEPVSDPVEAALGVRWTLAQPGVAAAVPPGDERLFSLALKVAGKDRPPSAVEEAALRELAASLQPIFSA